MISLKLSAYRLPIDSMPRPSFPNFARAIEQAPCSPSGAYILKKVAPHVGFVLSRSISSRYPWRSTHKITYPGVSHHPLESCIRVIYSDLPEKTNSTEKVQVDSSRCIMDDKESHTRGGNVHGNKGRVPWNKARKHSEETRIKIRHRTKEALKDPKVRKKMSEAPRALSNQTKAKIRTSLTKLWGERLKQKRSREKFLQLWKESIAEVAKIGGPDQQQLEWDSYQRCKQEIALLQIRRAAEKAEAKEAARVQAEREAHLKAEKATKLAQKRRERKEKAKFRGESNRKRNKRSKEEKEKLAEFQEVKLKEKLMKIHRKKLTINHMSHQHLRPWEKVDMELAKGEWLQRKISLAEQIRFAKSRRENELLDKL